MSTRRPEVPCSRECLAGSYLQTALPFSASTICTKSRGGDQVGSLSCFYSMLCVSPNLSPQNQWFPLAVPSKEPRKGIPPPPHTQTAHQTNKLKQTFSREVLNCPINTHHKAGQECSKLHRSQDEESSRALGCSPKESSVCTLGLEPVAMAPAKNKHGCDLLAKRSLFRVL